MLKRSPKTMRRDERGITGLETAIILIAFVVVASVFAYTVLSAGIFSSQKGQEAVYAGLSEARATMEIKGSMFARGNGTAGNMTVDAVSFTLTNAMKGQAIDLTPNTGNGSANVVVVSYADSTQRVDDLYWKAEQLGKGNADDMLDPGETFEMTIYLNGAGETVGTYQTIDMEIKPPVGSVLVIERTTPAALADWMILN